MLSERIREICFLLGAKRNKSGKGLFSESAPCNPKTPHTPHRRKASERGTTAPLSKGARVTVCKRINK